MGVRKFLMALNALYWRGRTRIMIPYTTKTILVLVVVWMAPRVCVRVHMGGDEYGVFVCEDCGCVSFSSVHQRIDIHGGPRMCGLQTREIYLLERQKGATGRWWCRREKTRRGKSFCWRVKHPQLPTEGRGRNDLLYRHHPH